MLGIGMFVLWAGYAITYYGADLITGGCDSFGDLVVPGRWRGVRCTDHAPAAAATKPGPATGQPQPGTPTTTVPLPGGGSAPGGIVGAPHIGARGDVGSPIPGSVFG